MTASYVIWPYHCVDAMLHLMDEGSINCVVTSPPYFGLRNYDHPDQLGHEVSPDEYVARLIEVGRAVGRVLRNDGTFWLNLGDSYAGSWGARGRGPRTNAPRPDLETKYGTNPPGRYGFPALGIKEKDLMGLPWRVALALQADGWYLRQAIVWRKTNPMPESVRDRCTRSYEQVFMFSKAPQYYYDAAAIAEPAVSTKDKKWTDGGRDKQRGHGRRHAGFNGRYAERLLRDGPPKTRNRRDVWTVATTPFKGAHFATFPPDLIEPCILAGCPVGGTVLDPFGGSGTTALVALRNDRNAVLCELNPEYVEMAHRRIAGGK